MPNIPNRLHSFADRLAGRVVSAMLGGRDRPAPCIDCGAVLGVFVTSFKIGDYLVLCSPCSAKREGRTQDGAADIDPPDTIRVYVGTGVGSTTARAEIERQTDAAYAELLTELDAKAGAQAEILAEFDAPLFRSFCEACDEAAADGRDGLCSACRDKATADRCAACGHPGSDTDPLTPGYSGHPVHTSHLTDPNSGLYRPELTEDQDGEAGRP